MTLHFTAEYREQVEIGDRVVEVRPVRPDDKALLRAGFEQMSPESRYRRFFAVKSRLTDDEVRYLTEVDGYDHFALGVVHRREDGSEEGVGVGRLVRLEQDIAEMAVAVIDEWQGRGIGTLLFQRLVAAARERGIHRIRAEVLATHQPLRHLVEALGLPFDTRVEDGIIIADVILPELGPEHPIGEPPREHPGYRLLSLAAQGLAELRRGLPAWLGGIPDDDDGDSAGDPGSRDEAG